MFKPEEVQAVLNSPQYASVRFTIDTTIPVYDAKEKKEFTVPLCLLLFSSSSCISVSPTGHACDPSRRCT
jgi:hypothetical protein